MSFQADIAQLVEQRIRNAKVVGSTLLSAPFKHLPKSTKVFQNPFNPRIKAPFVF